jgi:hypothetical protein
MRKTNDYQPSDPKRSRDARATTIERKATRAEKYGGKRR